MSNATETITKRQSSLFTDYVVGDCIEVTHRRVAIIRYIGKVADHKGQMYGIEYIDGSTGSHNGTLNGVAYFHGAVNRCQFVSRGDIRRKLKRKHNSDALNRLTSLEPRTKMESMIVKSPVLPLDHVLDNDKEQFITLKIRCQCFADPIPISVEVDVAQHSMLYLKQQIVSHCHHRTNLSVFTRVIESQAYSAAVDLYAAKNTDTKLKLKAGDMTHGLTNKYAADFNKLSLNQNTSVNDQHTDHNVPLQYFRLSHGQQLYALFRVEIGIKIVLQKTLFVKKSESAESAEIENTQSDARHYHHHCRFTVNLRDKFETLYGDICRALQITDGVSGIKLLSQNFIYNKSLFVEKLIHNEHDTDSYGDDVHREELSLYFMHLYADADAAVARRHRYKPSLRNFGSRSARGPLNSHAYSASIATMRPRAAGVPLTTTASAIVKSAATRAQHSFHGSNSSVAKLYSRANQKYGVRHLKVLLSFESESSRSAESYTILDNGITVRQLRAQIAKQFAPLACDRIQWNQTVLDDEEKTLLSANAIENNDILHIADESRIVIRIVDSAHKQQFELTVNRKRSVRHIKFEIVKRLKYPIASQTLIMKEVLRDDDAIEAAAAGHGIKAGDTLRLVYNFGKRVKKLPNQRLKLPVVRFDGSHTFEVVVYKHVEIAALMRLIQDEHEIAVDKQRLYFHGVALQPEQRLSDYNVTHEVHMFMAK